MCMSMKMFVCINVNQHVFGSIKGEMSKGDRYYPFISVLIEFSLVFFFFFENIFWVCFALPFCLKIYFLLLFIALNLFALLLCGEAEERT